MKDAFGIVEDCGKREWHWRRPRKFRVAVEGPGSLAYPDRASAERDAEEIRAVRPDSDLTVVETAPDLDRFYCLAEGYIENSIDTTINNFSKERVSLGEPPATRDEIVKALAHTVHYMLVYLVEPDNTYCPPNENDPPDTVRLEKVEAKRDLKERFIEALRNGVSYDDLD
jgi:hypothetical protein